MGGIPVIDPNTVHIPGLPADLNGTYKAIVQYQYAFGQRAYRYVDITAQYSDVDPDMLHEFVREIPTWHWVKIDGETYLMETGVLDLIELISVALSDPPYLGPECGKYYNYILPAARKRVTVTSHVLMERIIAMT